LKDWKVKQFKVLGPIKPKLAYLIVVYERFQNQMDSVIFKLTIGPWCFYYGENVNKYVDI
jgi:hypothetical protein